MRKIKTFNELYEIENKKYHTTCVLDLKDDFKKWKPGEQNYFKHYFLGEPVIKN